MINTLHVFTEEPSARNVFEAILPKLLPDNISFRIYDHQGKKDLEQALKKTIPSISKVPGSVILITRDQDEADCKEIKRDINKLIKTNCCCPYLIRIICHELESWFLGDLYAISYAFPRFKPENFQNKAEFRDVDKISYSKEYLLRIIPEYSDRNRLPVLETSEKIAQYLRLDSNSSKSFNNTISGIKKLINN